MPMLTTPSRKQKREAKFQYFSERGQFDVNDISLFKSEARTLRHQGFEVTRSNPDSKSSVPSKVSWENAFRNCGISPIVSNYIDGITNQFPYAFLSNWAQELYVTAARANKEKAQTINE